MKIWTLIENTASREDLAAEHGLSLYIETGSRKILFDAGQSGAFADNARKLGIDLSRVDTAILSHGHYDHGGGLARFLQINAAAPVYVSPHAFEAHYNASGKYIGLDPALAESGRLLTAGDEVDLGDGITLLSCLGWERPYPTDTGGLTVAREGRQVPEDFRHEQYLLIREGEKRILFSGCSHRGIRNIAGWFRPDVLVGGFHFKHLDPAGDGSAVLTQAARDLLEHPTVYYTGHCTGQEQFAFLAGMMGQRLHSLSTGAMIEF